MKVETKRGEAANILDTLEKVSSRKANSKFTDAITKNKEAIRAEAEVCHEVVKPSKGYLRRLKNLEKERVSLEEAYAKKNRDEHNEMSLAFRRKAQKLVKEQEKKKSEMETTLNEEVIIEFQPIDIDDCPQLSAKQMETIKLFIANKSKEK